MKAKIRSILFQVLAFIIAMALCLGGWALGYVFGFKMRTLFIILSACLGAVIIAAAIVNCTMLYRRTKAAMRQDCDLRLALLQKYPTSEQAAKYAKKTVKLAYAYLISLIVIITLLCYCVGQCGGSSESMTVHITICIIAVFLMSGLIEVLQPCKLELDGLAGYRIDKSEFPVLFDVCERAATAAGCRKPIQLYLQEDGICVYEQKNAVAIGIGFLQAATFTSNEMYCALLYNIADCVNANSQLCEYARKAAVRWNFDGGNVLSSFSKITLLSAAQQAAQNAFEVLTEVSERERKQNAVNAVINSGSAQTYVNALSKNDFINRFFARPATEVYHKFCEQNASANNYASYLLDLYNNTREVYGEKWREFMSRECDSQLDFCHPFMLAMREFGCDSFYTDGTEQDPFYCAEMQRVITKADRGFADSTFYRNFRETFYSEPEKLAASYEAKLLSGAALSAQDHITAMNVYLTIDEQKALAVADAILADTPDSPEANLAKGLILSSHYNDECLRYFKTAALNHEFEDEALCRIAEYAYYTSNWQILQEYLNSPDARYFEYILRGID